MNNTTKFFLTGVATLGILGIGTAGAMAMTSSLGVKDQAGTVQTITPVKTGSSTSAPTSSPTPVPSGATTVAPAAPVYLDDEGLRSGTSDDSSTHTGTGHEVGDDNGVDPAGHDATDDSSGDTSGVSDKSGYDGSKSGSSTTGSGSSGSNDSGSDHN
jgi:hypothetical protein